MKWLKRRLYLGDWVAFSQSATIHSNILHPTRALCFKYTSMNSGVSLWDSDLQNFGPKAKNRRLFLLAPVCVCQAVTTQGPTASDCQLWCLHIFAAVATNIAETRCDGSNQVWSQLMTHEQLLEPLVEKSTCYGVMWHSGGRHSLEGLAWSRPGYPQWTW